jgi:signal transduction histidine kinase
MRRLPRTVILTVGVALTLTIAFAVLAMMLYRRTEEGVVKSHSRDQQLLAELAATGLAQRVDSRLHSVEALAAVLQGVPAQRRGQQLRELPPVEASGTALLLLPDGTIHFRESPPNPAAIEEGVLPWLDLPGPVLTNPIQRESGASEVVLMVPLVVKERVVGRVGVTFEFEPLVESLFPSGAASTHVGVNLLDEKGTVLANTRHPEMVGRRVPSAIGSCQPCHSNFRLEQRMLRGEADVVPLQVGEASKSLLAFTPVQLPGRRWSLSISEPYSALIADARDGFRAISLLLAFSLVTGILATAIIIQVRARHRRAEERAALAERRTTLERQMIQNQQLAAMGKMTSQIAHEINTPLAALGLNVSYLRAEVQRRLGESSPEIEEASLAIAEEISRLKRVVNDYLRFARVPQPTPAVASIREAVESFLEFLEPEARHQQVKLESALGDDPAYALLDNDLFRQAFLNLAQNALEAMPTGGVLRVELEAQPAEVILRVRDTGAGIPAETLPQVFDPFFTTKKDGTGLGLAHACQSRPGEGTLFTVRLPAGPAPTDTSQRLEEFSLAGKGR